MIDVWHKAKKLKKSFGKGLPSFFIVKICKHFQAGKAKNMTKLVTWSGNIINSFGIVAELVRGM